MDSLKPSSVPTKNKLAKTIHKVIHLRKASKSLSSTGFCLLIPQDPKLKNNSQRFDKDNNNDEARSRNRAAMEAFAAKLFASISAVKAAYAELQMAQFPYNCEAIQSADEAVVYELKSLSELKQSFLKKQLDSSPPHVTMLLAEIQEQQSLMKMFDITMNKMRSELDTKESEISALYNELNDAIANNKFLEKRLDSSGQFSIIESVKLSNANPSSFNGVLHYAVRSVRSFVKLMIREMESSNWDIDSAASAIEPGLVFPKPNHRCFAFESFVCKEIFDGFNSPNFLLPNDSKSSDEQGRFVFLDRFKKLKSVNPIQFLKNNPNSAFGKFVRTKYLRLVHPKMETSFSGNLSQRKMINSGEFPETGFFAAFAEMAKRVWLLHCFAFSFDQEVNIFQVGKNCRFSEVYMDSVTDDALFTAAECGGVEGGFRVAFTVVPGFKIGKTVIQSQVYLFPASTPAKR
ncbi:Protein GRAVITROPIC IN THE LIGHT 1 [Camellia lanceoleosa]|uniref:Protein GRAVITROPIC IN THE LIGHT 1 n=1 Tax=Camellia lanceoleosa TaxID=1840588 RepID=A0ACC0GM27_9ERIC|nr:Protein GRAVITROPIC IN THE LIGHT 1 [Camellia lanceoleosa]